MAATENSLFVPSQQPRAASGAAILRTWFLQELLLLLRQPIAVFFSLAFPLVIYLFIGLPFAEQQVDEGVRYIDLIFPALLGTAVANLAVMGLPIYLSELRTRRSDIRYRTLPLPLIYFGTALVLSMLVLSILGLLVVSIVIGIAHGLLPTAANPFFWLLIFLMIGWLSCIGFFVGSLPFDARAIQGISAVLFFVMYFGSGAAVPITELPQVMQNILEWNPLKQWFEALGKIYTGQEIGTTLAAKLFIALPLSAAAIAGGLLLWRKRQV
ncbi:ABC transporter permease [Brevibacterium atlanticum]|uniref:ABC transporter permease n=1 Tax=Brevibacterium atlanticum TaxID=2697563 RepID=UPI0014229C7B|nr:ABC transporter permease [Brevibacterium atlanticum]